MSAEESTGRFNLPAEVSPKRARLDEGLAGLPAQQRIVEVAAILAVGFLRLANRRPWRAQQAPATPETNASHHEVSNDAVREPIVA